MPFIPAPNCYKLEIRWLVDGQETENVFYVKNEDPLSPVSMTALGDAVGDWWLDTMRANVANSALYTGTKVTDMSSATAESVFSNHNANTVGTEPNPLPNNVTFSVHKECAGRGRSNQGRVYVPAIGQGVRAGINGVSSTYGTDLCNAYLALKTELEGAVAGSLLGIVSFFTGGLPRAAGVFSEILDFVCRDFVLDSQRRRLPKRGN